MEPENIAIEEEFLLESGPVDILWVVDNSGTMADAQAAVGDAFPSLLAELSVLAIDWRLGLLSTDMSDPDHRGRLLEVDDEGSILMDSTTADAASRFAGLVRLGDEGSPVERGLEASWAALSDPLASHDNHGFLREEARLAIIYVSDDEDCSHEGGLPIESSAACAADPASLVSVGDYLVRYEGLKANPLDVSLHALVETGVTAEFEGCGGSNPGMRIMRAARGTGGMVAPLCGDLTPSLTELGKQLAGRRSSFPLGGLPAEGSLQVQTRSADASEEAPTAVVQDITMQNGWTWDESSNSIRLWGAAVPDLGTIVRVEYTVGFGG